MSCESPSKERKLELPCFILEVLCESTADTDHGKKLEEYTRLPSMQVYAIAAQDEPRVVVYKRDASGWRVEVLEGEGQLEVVCLKTTLSMEQIYRGLDFPHKWQGLLN